ncbi:MAG: ASCH domain-containing protein [Sphingomonadales bacterium]|nr:ASCH domain-containing protein [Sphingomonadales bacterium]
MTADPFTPIIEMTGFRPSVAALWARYRALEPAAPTVLPCVEYFCDNARDADLCADLVQSGRKRATSSALIDYQRAGDPLPLPGKLLIVTDWAGEAKALIRTHSVTVRRFDDVPEIFARLEGEGDLSPVSWRAEHRAFWNRLLMDAGVVVDGDFQVVCEEFELLLAT